MKLASLGLLLAPTAAGLKVIVEVSGASDYLSMSIVIGLAAMLGVQGRCICL